MANRPTRRKSQSGSIDMEGSRVSYEIYNGGLGKRYFDKLGQDLDQIIQCTKIKDVVAKCIAENTGLMWFCDKCSDKVSEKLANLHTDASSSSIAELQVTRKENECLHREIQLMKKILADQDYVISLQKQTIENRESKIITQDQDIVNKPIVSSAKNKKISYRDIAARNKNKNQLVLTPVDKSKGVDMQKEVRRLLNPGELQVNIDSVKTTAVGNVVISCDSEDSLNKIKSRISNKDLNKDDQAILAEIIARNGMQAYSEGFVRIVKKLHVKNRNGYSDVVIEVSHPVRDIIVDVSTGVTETRGSVRGRAVKLAIEMKRRGIKQDDIIVMCSRTNNDQVIVVLASLFIGAILAPLDPEFNYKEVLDLMKQLKPRLCFGDSRTIPQFDRIFQALNMNITTVNFNPDQAGTVQFRKLLLAQKEDDKFTPNFVEGPKTTVAFILPTQGTTGLPKLICLSHENIFIQTVILLDVLGQPDKVLSFFPVSWFFQMILVCLTFERPVTRIIPVMFTERNACKIIHDFSIRHAILGTDYAMKMANSPALKDYNLNCLRAVMIGTVNTMKHDVQTLRQHMPHVKFLQCYCLTETGCIAATRLSSYSKSMMKNGGIGPLTMNCRIRIVDTETRRGVGPNCYGELLYTGDGLMLGYLRQSEKTKQSMEKGFFKTGDLAMVDEDGWLYVKGRTDDLINLDGCKLSPLDLEEVILTHPAVKDVCVEIQYSGSLASIGTRDGREFSPKRLSEETDESDATTLHYSSSDIPTAFPFVALAGSDAEDVALSVATNMLDDIFGIPRSVFAAFWH
nr:unnamed protein product [Callosobruchus analis]